MLCWSCLESCVLVFEREDAEKVLLPPYAYYDERNLEPSACGRCRRQTPLLLEGEPSLPSEFRGLAFQHYAAEDGREARLLSLDGASWDPKKRVLTQRVYGAPRDTWALEIGDATGALGTWCAVFCGVVLCAFCCDLTYAFYFDEQHRSAAIVPSCCSCVCCCTAPLVSTPRWLLAFDAFKTDDPDVWRRETRCCRSSEPHVYLLKFAVRHEKGAYVRTAHWATMTMAAPRRHVVLR